MDRRTLLARKDRSDNYRMSEISKMKTYRCNDASKGKRRDPGNEVGKNRLGRIMWYNKRHGNEFLGTCDHIFCFSLGASRLIDVAAASSLFSL